MYSLSAIVSSEPPEPDLSVKSYLALEITFAESPLGYKCQGNLAVSTALAKSRCSTAGLTSVIYV